jgi:metal-responsive CopG/Arc/MetJ family transcriptional regulator
MKTNKPTIATRIAADELAQIDAMIQEMGQSRSEWLYQIIREALGHSDAQTVQSMATRLAALERKLSRLAS